MVIGSLQTGFGGHLITEADRRVFGERPDGYLGANGASRE